MFFFSFSEGEKFIRFDVKFFSFCCLNIKICNAVLSFFQVNDLLSTLIFYFLNFNQVPLPEKPDTEDEAEIQKWKWKVKAANKQNNERHSLRCDVELKLAVRTCPKQ